MGGHPIIDAVLASGTVTDNQAFELRRTLYADAKISETEAAWLFEINDTCTSPSKAWQDFFVEALSTSSSIRPNQRAMSATQTPAG